jgi:hypothetical protein
MIDTWDQSYKKISMYITKGTNNRVFVSNKPILMFASKNRSPQRFSLKHSSLFCGSVSNELIRLTLETKAKENSTSITKEPNKQAFPAYPNVCKTRSLPKSGKSEKTL